MRTIAYIYDDVPYDINDVALDTSNMVDSAGLPTSVIGSAVKAASLTSPETSAVKIVIGDTEIRFTNGIVPDGVAIHASQHKGTEVADFSYVIVPAVSVALAAMQVVNDAVDALYRKETARPIDFTLVRDWIDELADAAGFVGAVDQYVLKLTPEAKAEMETVYYNAVATTGFDPLNMLPVSSTGESTWSITYRNRTDNTVQITSLLANGKFIIPALLPERIVQYANIEEVTTTTPKYWTMTGKQNVNAVIRAFNLKPNQSDLTVEITQPTADTAQVEITIAEYPLSSLQIMNAKIEAALAKLLV